MRLNNIHANLDIGVGSLAFHITLFDWRVLGFRKKYFVDVETNRRDYWLGPFRVQYAISKKV